MDACSLFRPCSHNSASLPSQKYGWLAMAGFFIAFVKHQSEKCWVHARFFGFWLQKNLGHTVMEPV